MGSTTAFFNPLNGFNFLVPNPREDAAKRDAAMRELQARLAAALQTAQMEKDVGMGRNEAIKYTADKQSEAEKEKAKAIEGRETKNEEKARLDAIKSNRIKARELAEARSWAQRMNKFVDAQVEAYKHTKKWWGGTPSAEEVAAKRRMLMEEQMSSNQAGFTRWSKAGVIYNPSTGVLDWEGDHNAADYGMLPESKQDEIDGINQPKDGKKPKDEKGPDPGFPTPKDEPGAKVDPKDVDPNSFIYSKEVDPKDPKKSVYVKRWPGGPAEGVGIDEPEYRKSQKEKIQNPQVKNPDAPVNPGDVSAVPGFGSGNGGASAAPGGQTSEDAFAAIINGALGGAPTGMTSGAPFNMNIPAPKAAVDGSLDDRRTNMIPEQLLQPAAGLPSNVMPIASRDPRSISVMSPEDAIASIINSGNPTPRMTNLPSWGQKSPSEILAAIAAMGRLPVSRR